MKSSGEDRSLCLREGLSDLVAFDLSRAWYRLARPFPPLMTPGRPRVAPPMAAAGPTQPSSARRLRVGTSLSVGHNIDLAPSLLASNVRGEEPEGLRSRSPCIRVRTAPPEATHNVRPARPVPRQSRKARHNDRIRSQRKWGRMHWIENWHMGLTLTLVALLFMGAFLAITRLVANASPARDTDRLESPKQTLQRRHAAGEMDQETYEHLVHELDGPPGGGGRTE